MTINTVKIYLCSEITPSEAIQKFFEGSLLHQNMPICHKRNASRKHAELDSFFKAGQAVLEARPAAAPSWDLAGAWS